MPASLSGLAAWSVRKRRIGFELVISQQTGLSTILENGQYNVAMKGNKPKREKPVSLYPLGFTEAVRGLGMVKVNRKRKTRRRKKK